MPADGRVGAAGGARDVLDEPLVEGLAHAVQALELVASTPPARSTMEATVSALWVANCGKMRGRSAAASRRRPGS